LGMGCRRCPVVAQPVDGAGRVLFRSGDDGEGGKTGDAARAPAVGTLVYDEKKPPALLRLLHDPFTRRHPNHPGFARGLCECPLRGLLTQMIFAAGAGATAGGLRT